MSLLSLGGISMLFLRVVDPALCIVLLIGSGMSLMRAAKRAAWQSAAALAATVMLGLLLAVGVCPSRVGDISIHVFPGRITPPGPARRSRRPRSRMLHSGARSIVAKR